MNRAVATAHLRQAQQASWAGRHDRALTALDQAAAGPPGTALAVQGALVRARAEGPAAGLAWLDQMPESAQAGQVVRLFRGFLLARLQQTAEAVAQLELVAAAQPENHVVTSALAYAWLRAGQPGTAARLLSLGLGDNLEVLSWVWLELERAALSEPLPAEPAPAPVAAPPGGARAAWRWYRAGVAAAQGNTNCVWRRRLLDAADGPRAGLPARWLAPLLRRLEQRWPSCALTAFRGARAAGIDAPELAFQLGAQWYETGCPRAALVELEQAWQAAGDSPEAYLPGLYRVAALVDCRRWTEAGAALEAVARRDLGDEAGPQAVHEFGQPYWLMYRGLVRLGLGDDEAAQADLLRALLAEPVLLEERLSRLRRRLPWLDHPEGEGPATSNASASGTGGPGSAG